MKAIFITFFLFLHFFIANDSIAQKKYPYNITGIISNPVNTKIYLALDSGVANSQKKIIDSVAIVNGAFNLKGQTNIGMYAIFVSSNKQWKRVFVDGSKINIMMNKDSIYMAKVTGSLEMDLLEQLDKKIKPIKSIEQKLLETMLGYQKRQRTDSLNLVIPEFKATQARLYQEVKEFLAVHPNSYAALDLYDRYGKKLYSDSVIISKINAMPEKYKELGLYRSILSKHQSTLTFAVGHLFQDFELPEHIDNRLFNTKSLDGKYKLIDFWASWCVPCRNENPNLKKQYSKYQKKGFEIVSVSIDTDTLAWKQAIKEDQLPWKQVIARQKDPRISAYHIIQIPTSYLVDPKGKIIAINPRGEKLEKELAKIFNDI